MSLRSLSFIVAALLAAASFLPRQVHAQQVDVIRGRVTGPDSLPIENVSVTVTSISGNVNRSSRTDRNGRFTVTFPGGDGDYMVSFVAMGFAPRRFEVKRIADEEVLIADARLQKVGAVLDAVNVTTTRERVNRNEANAPDVSGTEQAINPAALPADQLGDLAAMAASLPGVQLVPGENGDPNGYSVLGLGADQNNTTLNGMNFGGANLPRDAAISTSLVTSPYDVSRGGFSGAQMNIRTRPGSNFITRGMSLNLDAPQMQWTDRAAQALGQEYLNASLGGTVSGPITFDKAFYSLAYQLGRRSNDLQTLLNTDATGLEAAGVAADSVDRLLGILSQSEIPVTTGGIPRDRLSDQGSLFGSIDFAPPSSSSGQAWNISFNGNWNRQRPTSSFATEVPAFGGERTSWRGGVQARHSGYFGFGILTETSLGVSGSITEAAPFVTMPSGRVRVSSTLPDGESGVPTTLSFGGNQSLNSTQRATNVAALNQLSWFSANNKHRLKLTSELRLDGSSQEQASNLLGSFTFNSLADLEAGRAATFTRTLAPRERSMSQLVAGVSLGDAWRKTNDLQIQYGIRVDANRFLDAPAFNPAVEQTFGVRNDQVPNRIEVSPRVGFSWTYGTAAQVAGFAGAARGPRAVVRGGIGLFQSTPGTTAIGSALENTGLPSGVQQLNCVGPAVPVPDWDAYASDPSLIPQRCADGTTGSVFANTAPNVTLLASDYRAPRSVRSNLQWSGPVLGNRFSATVEGTYSMNLNQSGFVDLNFAPAQQFTLPEEGRPVFVQPTSIDPGTGAIASRGARVSTEFSRVTEMRSDLRSESRQLSFRLSPVRFSTGFSWSASYVYSNVREKVRGFGSTAGNPLDVEWARSAFDSRHQLVYNLGYNFFDFVRVNWFGSFRSGRPFTPTVAGDVNGDGYANDRAFVFDPAQVSEPAVASAMQQILEHGSDAARDCLRKQLGRLAGRNSCEGPWSSTASMSVSFNPAKVRMPQRATLSFQISNPLGAADLLVNGSDDLRGWGQPASPDAALLYVRGFDPVTQRFAYEVNQRFGKTNQALAQFRAPVTITAMMRVDVGPTRERQMLTQQLDRGRSRQGTKMPEAMIKAMYGGGSIPNPMATILREQDTLKLTGPQADSIATLNRRYVTRVDSIWSPVAKYLASLPDQYDHDDAYDRYIRARRATVDVLIAFAPTIKGILTPEQQRKLPPFIASYLEPRYLASIRNGTAAYTGAGFGAPGISVPGGAVPMMIGGGGGGAMTIIRH